jgi:ABC-type iron transport system FetAB ATPase subunit
MIIGLAATVLGTVKLITSSREKTALSKFTVESGLLKFKVENLEGEQKKMIAEIKGLSTKTGEFLLFRSETSAQLTTIQKSIEVMSHQLLRTNELQADSIKLLHDMKGSRQK